MGASSWVDSDVVIGTGVVVGRNVHLGPGSRVGDGARISDGARLGGAVVIAPGARVSTDSVIPDRSVVLCTARRTPRSDFGTAA